MSAVSAFFRKAWMWSLVRVIPRTFRFWERLGVHVTLNSYLSPIPDTRDLTDEVLGRHTDLRGVAMREAEQVAWLAEMAAKYRHEYERFPARSTGNPHEYYIENPSFSGGDAEILWMMIREAQPAKVIEIGSGFSTLVAAAALVQNEKTGGRKGALIAIEPYPRDFIRQGFPGLSELRPERVERVPMDIFEALGEDDILFIDSSHVLKTGSDVQYEFLEILPRLQKGVLVHVHDICLPAEYPEIYLRKQQIFWNEQYLLQAFLAFNDAFEVLWAGAFMHFRHPDALKAAIPSYDGQRWPGSFWLRKIR
jgi:predicted O-methyltransferase YrrM